MQVPDVKAAEKASFGQRAQINALSAEGGHGGGGRIILLQPIWLIGVVCGDEALAYRLPQNNVSPAALWRKINLRLIEVW